jgi:acyl transferase domain-containing protein
MSGRFPKAENVGEFWENVRGGVEGITFFSNEELLEAGVSWAKLRNPRYVRAAGLIGRGEEFDADLFKFAAREAEITDPQHRVFLECAWEALEDAGYDPLRFPGLIGVYAGAASNGYVIQALSRPDLLESVGLFQAMISTERDFLPTQVSYRLNLRGPSLGIQTACSTSLVAVHLACQSLLCFECDVALAGGVSICVPELHGYVYQEEGIASPDGHCRPFDARAAGTVSSNGAGIVVLRRLADALADRDRIIAVIKGSAINNDGSGKLGYTAPSINGQAEVIAAAQAMADVDPETISYIEAHGTGTHLGDPVEVAALSQVFSARTKRRGFCALGSVKSNIGHLDTAAGVAGLIKTALALQHRELPPNLHYERPNPRIDFEHSPFYVNTRLQPWPGGITPRRAGVSSFGIGGTNAHVILEEAPPQESSTCNRSWQVITLSAKNAAALEAANEAFVNHRRKHPDQYLANVAYTLHVGRQQLAKRQAVVAGTLSQACKRLEQNVRESVSVLERPQVAFLFPGQGSQRAGMGAQLYAQERLFRETIDTCCQILMPFLDVDLRTFLLAPPSKREEANALLQQTRFTQPALFVFEYALAQLWMSWGVRPAALLGHSIGEYVAACVAGMMPLKAALELVVARGNLMQALPTGAMLAVAANKEYLVPRMHELDLAAVNAPELCVVAGPETAIAALESDLSFEGRATWRLQTSHAFHSAMMEPILESLRRAVARIPLQPPQIPMVSNLSGGWVGAETITQPDYWVRHARQAVQFASGIHCLLQTRERLLLEVGPGQTLSQLARRQQIDPNHVMPGLRVQEQPDDPDENEQILGTLGKLWELGVPINWTQFHAGERLHRVALPTYPFQRKRYWIAPASTEKSNTTMPENSHHRQDIRDWFYLPCWKRLPLPASAANSSKQSGRRCLLLTESSELGAALDGALRADGWEVTQVHAGEQWEQTGSHKFVIDPAQPSSYDRLWRQLLATGLPERIIHLWNMSKPDLNGRTEQMVSSFYSLTYMAQAIGSLQVRNPFQMDLFVFSTGLHGIDASDQIEPDKGVLLGPCRVLPKEYAQIRCHSIDVPLMSVHRPDAAQIQQWLAEMHANPADPIVAYRGPHRWVPGWESITLEETPRPTTTLRSGGGYLITGGLGGLGLELARYLSTRAQARIVLLSRSALPQHSEWEDWLLTHDQQNSTSRRIRKLQALEVEGAELLIVSADVANPEQMRQVQTKIQERFGEIHGIFHAAGVPGSGLTQLRTKEQMASVLAPKVQGTITLAELFPDVELLVLFSSLSSVLGEIGQIDYCAANCFLDAFALAAEGHRTRTISINWDTWQQVGMAVETPIPQMLQSMRSNSLEDGIHPEEGWKVLDQILTTAPPRVAVSTRSLTRRLQIPPQKQLSSVVISTSVGLQTSHSRPDNAPPYVPPASPMEEILGTLWTELLGIAPIGRDDNFFHFGGHSLVALQLTSRIREQLGLEIPLNVVFDNPTPASFALQLSSENAVSATSRIRAVDRNGVLLSTSADTLEGMNRGSV